MKSKARYHKGYINRANYNLNAVQNSIKYHCNLSVNKLNLEMLSKTINRVWVSWIVDAAVNIAKAIKYKSK